jgi:hypothetical protein
MAYETAALARLADIISLTGNGNGNGNVLIKQMI